MSTVFYKTEVTIRDIFFVSLGNKNGRKVKKEKKKAVEAKKKTYRALVVGGIESIARLTGGA